MCFAQVFFVKVYLVYQQGMAFENTRQMTSGGVQGSTDGEQRSMWCHHVDGPIEFCLEGYECVRGRHCVERLKMSWEVDDVLKGCCGRLL